MPTHRVTWFGRSIDLNEIYYLYFPEKKREMTEKQLAEYKGYQALPDKLRIMSISKMNPANNPNILPVTGRELIDISKNNRAIPTFDQHFITNKKVTLFPAEAYDFFEEYSHKLNSQ